MRDGVEALSEREKETLRLLLAGHDAKSISRDLGLSIHTVNERLREARRKLHVSSSREAARLLGDVDLGAPNNLVDKRSGVAASPGYRAGTRSPGPFFRAGYPLAWLGGGMLIMSLIVAAAVILPALHSGAETRTNAPAVQAPVETSASETSSAGARSAREWVTLLDGQHWTETWQEAGAIFKAQMAETRWASVIQPLRQPLGAVSSRTFRGVTKTNALPGAPVGEYEIVQFETDFANKRGTIETVVLAHEATGWKVDGYFMR